MRKLVVCLLIFTVILGSLSGCKGDAAPGDTQPTAASVPQTEPTQTDPTQTEPTQTEPTEIVEEAAIGHEDTYWVAESWYSLDGEGAEGSQTLEPEMWFLDLLIRVDGTARFRDVHESVCLTDDSYQTLSWERTESGRFLFYNELYPTAVIDGAYDNGILTVEYMDLTFTMKQAPIPQTAGQRELPAELAGTWLMVSGETEGWQWEAMPGQLASLVFRVTSYSGPLILEADMEDRDYYGTLNDSDYGLEVEVLPEPLYDGCGNEAWSVRIGPAAPRDANGFPQETEFYATLLDYNTLVLQQCYTLDGYPAVSHQIYARFPDLVSWQTPEYMELRLSNWDCVGYFTPSGEELPMPAELEGMTLLLDMDQICTIQYGDGRSAEGIWQLEHGGVMLLRSHEEAENPFWYGGAVSGYCVETTYEISDTYQMSLYYNGGILKLMFNGYS